MSTMNPLDPYGGTTPPIEQMLGIAYDNVRKVAQNINVIRAVDANKENIDKAAQISDDVMTLKEEMEVAVSTSQTAATSATSSANVARASELSAKNDAISANQSAQSASQSANTATSLVGSVKKAILYYDTFAEAQAAAATLPDGQVVEIDADENLDGRRTRYFKRAGDVLEFAVNLDQVLLDLADSVHGGASMVGYGSGTVEDALDLISKSTANADKSAGSVLIDMHYGICRGVGYNGTGGERVTAASELVYNGYNIPVIDAYGFVAGQLIAYLGADGEYYTAVVASIAANILTLQTPIEAPIASGAEVGIFYTQESHATRLGYKAIADYAIRKYGKKFETVWSWMPGDSASLIAGATLDSLSSATYANPGSAASPSALITAPAGGAGVSVGGISLPAGDYVARICATPIIGAGSRLITTVSEDGPAISYSDLNFGGTPMVRELNFRKSSSGKINVNCLCADAGQQFAISRIDIFRVTRTVKNLNAGVHVLLGDSWFSLPGIYERLMERLPNAKIINKGIAGNTASDMWGRFDVDVRPHRPTHVWVMAGTNDVATGVPAKDFYRAVGIINSKVLEIDAQALIFDVSVGCPTNPTYGDLLTPSREYMQHSDYASQAADKISNTEIFKCPIYGVIPAGSSQNVLVLPGITKKSCVAKMAYIYGKGDGISGSVSIGYASSVVEDLIDGASFPLENSIKSNIEIAKSNSDNKFLMLAVSNTGGAPITVSGCIIIEWSPEK